MELAAAPLEQLLPGLCPAQGVHVSEVTARLVTDAGLSALETTPASQADWQRAARFAAPALVGESAGELAVIGEVQQGIVAEAVEPNVSAGIPVAHAHRDHPDMHAAIPRA
jgi:hypothetical protein